MVKKSNSWNLQEMQETLVKDTEQRISDGFQEIASASAEPKPTENILGEKTQTSSVSHQPSEQEPTKGVQTHITMEDYRRLMEVKLRRDAAVIQQPRTTIAKLAAEAIGLWLDVQEGKREVS